MATKRTTQTVEVEGLKETLRAFNKFGKEANSELRAAARDIATATAREAAGKAKGQGKMASAVAESIVAKSDRVPRIDSGGRKKVTSRGTAAGALFFGTEFGGSQPQFRPHLGQQGYFLWPTIRQRQSRDIALYQRALDNLIDRWSRG